MLDEAKILLLKLPQFQFSSDRLISSVGILASNLILLSLKVKLNSKQDLKIIEIWKSILTKPQLTYSRILLTQTHFNLFWSKKLLLSGVELLLPLDEEL